MSCSSRNIILTILFILFTVGYLSLAFLPPKILFPEYNFLLQNLGSFLQRNYLFLHKLQLNEKWYIKFASMDQGIKDGYPFLSLFPCWNETKIPLNITSMSNNYYEGFWLGKTFSIPPEFYGDKRFHVFFDKIAFDSYIWINGHFVAFHRASLFPFSVEITQFINKHGLNTIVIFIQTHSAKEPLINSSLVVGNVELFTTQDFLVRSVLITPLSVDQNTAKIRVSLILENLLLNNIQINLKYSVFQKFNANSLVGTQNMELPPGLSFKSFELTISNPKLWSPSLDGSQLYFLSLNFYYNGEFSGSLVTSFGIRSVDLSSVGFSINNNFVYIRGVTLSKFDESTVKFLNCSKNSINTIHTTGFWNPEDIERLADYADATGKLLVVDFPSSLDPLDQFRYILTLYNHPSIVAWSETYKEANSYSNDVVVSSFKLSEFNKTILIDGYPVDYRPLLLGKIVFQGSFLDFIEDFITKNRDLGIVEVNFNDRLELDKLSFFLQLAISRIRIEKLNFSSGLIIDIQNTNLTETPLVEYLKPTTLLFDIRGDYEVTEKGIRVNPSANVYIHIWLVNDLPTSNSSSYSAEVSLYDTTLNELVNRTIIRNITLPSSVDYSKEILYVPYKIGEFYQEHTFLLNLNLFNSSVMLTKLNSSFYSLPVFLVQINLNRVINGFFVLNTSDKIILRNINGNIIDFKVGESKNVAIFGPFSKSDIVIPFSIFIKDLNDNFSIDIPVVYGSKIKVNYLPFIGGSFSYSMHIDYKLLGNNSQFSFIKSYNKVSVHLLDQSTLLYLKQEVPSLNFLTNEFIVPTSSNVSVTIGYMLAKTRGYIKKTFITHENETYEISDLEMIVNEENSKILKNTISDITKYINALESYGLYIEGTKDRVKNTLSLLQSTNSSNTETKLAMQKYSLKLLQDITQNIKNLMNPSPNFSIYILILTILLSLSIGKILFEEVDKSLIFSLIVFFALFTILVQQLPFIRIDVFRLIFLLLLLIIVGSVSFMVVYTIIGDIKTSSGVSLLSAISIMFSFISGFLSKRKFRTFLILSSVSIIAWGLTCLSSASISPTITFSTIGVKNANLDRSYLILSNTTEDISQRIFVSEPMLQFIDQINGVEFVSPRLIYISPITPIESIDGTVVSAFIGLSSGSPIIQLLKPIVRPSTAIYELTQSQGKVIVSDFMASNSGKQIGDVIFIRGRKFQIIGIFDSKKLGKMKDLDGQDILPKIIVDNAPVSIPPESVVLMSAIDASSLGAYVDKIYIGINNTPTHTNVDETAAALSLLQNCFVYIAEPNSIVKIYHPGIKLEIKGLEIIIPVFIALLIIFLSFSGYVYERRKEIFILTTIGASPDHIFLIFLYESLIIGFIGGTLGYISGIMTFSILKFLNISIPIDVKIDMYSSIYLIAFTILVSFLGALIPSLKSSTVAVPSLKRKWSTEAKLLTKEELDRTQELSVIIPVLIPQSRINDFVSFLSRSLRENTELPVSISNVVVSEEPDINGKLYKISFDYVSTSKFRSQNTLILRRSKDHYEIELRSRITTIFTLFIDQYLREVASFVREVSLRWSVEEYRVAVFVYNSETPILEVINSLKPRSLLVISRRDINDIIARVHLYSLNLPIEIRTHVIKSLNFQDIIKELSTLLSDVEQVYINTDDYILSSAAVLVATRIKKKLVTKSPEGNIVEINYGA